MIVCPNGFRSFAPNFGSRLAFTWYKTSQVQKTFGVFRTKTGSL